MNNDWYSIAVSDLQYLRLTLNTTYYNQMIVQCQQISEKMLKSVAELVCTEEIALKTHNLRQIDSLIKKNGINLNLNQSDLAYLKDFYFEARYPGDNFTEVTKEDFDKALAIMYTVVEKVTVFRTEKNLPCDTYEEISKSSKGLDKLLKCSQLP